MISAELVSPPDQQSSTFQNVFKRIPLPTSHLIHELMHVKHKCHTEITGMLPIALKAGIHT